MEQRAVLFIDGSNFHYRMAAIGLSAYRLDYAAFSQRLLTADQHWQETRYYIGRARQEGNPSSYRRQRRFLDALAKQHENLSIHLGRLEFRRAKEADNQLRRWLQTLPRRKGVHLPEHIAAELDKMISKVSTGHYIEKAVDVMIATDMVAMAHKDEFDVAHLLTADGDLSPAIREAQAAGKEVHVATPKRVHQLRQVADGFTLLTAEHFAGCWL